VIDKKTLAADRDHVRCMPEKKVIKVDEKPLFHQLKSALV